MIKLSTAQLWVHDQNEALDFYTNKLGWEVRSDATLPELGSFRWLRSDRPSSQSSSRADGDPGTAGDGHRDRGQVRELMSKGFAGTVFLTTDDCPAPTTRS